MVISDFNIICLAQKGAELFNSKMIKSTANNLNVKKVLTYIGWNIFQGFKGIWYEIYPKNRESKDYQYDQEFFDLDYKSTIYSDKLIALKNKRNRVICVKEYEKDILNIIDFYLEKSPIHRICVMIRVQDKEEEAILGTMSRKEFVYKLKNEELCYNVAYIVSLD
mgnify:CR=1 FL=1